MFLPGANRLSSLCQSAQLKRLIPSKKSLIRPSTRYFCALTRNSTPTIMLSVQTTMEYGYRPNIQAREVQPRRMEPASSCLACKTTFKGVVVPVKPIQDTATFTLTGLPSAATMAIIGTRMALSFPATARDSGGRPRNPQSRRLAGLPKQLSGLQADAQLAPRTWPLVLLRTDG